MSRLPLFILSALICFTGRVAIGGERVDLTPANESGQMTHVSIQLEAGGHNLVRAQQQDDKAPGAEQRQPISVAAKLTFDEKRLANSTTSKRV